MLDELLPYYEQELAALRELSGEFARRYPKIARRLALDDEQSGDPHVERLMEGFAFLSARIRRKIDDEFPEITEAFMQVLYPHYTQPFPSCTIVQFETDALRPEFTGRHTVPRHHPVLSSPVNGIPCRFRTCYSVDLYPLTLKDVRIQLARSSEHLRRTAPDATAALVLELETHGGLPLARLDLKTLRFFLDGDPALAHLLYELLLMRSMRVRCTAGNEHRAVELPAAALQPVGFEADDALMDADERSPRGHGLLSEYFNFPDKFLFVDLHGLDACAQFGDSRVLQIEIMLQACPDAERFERLTRAIGPQHFRMGCTPVINLFRQSSEPIRLTHEKTAYPVEVDSKRPRGFEIVAIRSVTCAERRDEEERCVEVPAFYSVRHHAARGGRQAFWYASRERSARDKDAGTDVKLSFIDADFSPQRPDLEVLSLDLLCSNRDLPAQLPFGASSSGTHTDFYLPQFGGVKRTRVLRKPTATVRPPLKRGLQWRLISHLSLNHLSLVAQGKDPLREMLTLYDFQESPTSLRQIQGILDVTSQPATTRIAGRHFHGFVRGLDVFVTLDEAAFTGAGVVLFGGVLERFLALYCGPNSFVRLTLLGKQQQEIARWPARAGDALVI